MKIEGKVAVVVGGAQGIGEAYCEALLSKGAMVVIADVQSDLGAKTNEGFGRKYGQNKSMFVKCDNTKDEDIENLFKVTIERFGRPDIVIHNAGIIHEFEWQKCCDINVGGAMRTTNEALRHMSKAKGGTGGAIIITASISSLRPEYWGPVYSATKYALLGYTLSWGLPANVEVTGVRFNCICPTTVSTEFLKSVNPERAYHSDNKQDVHATVQQLTPAFVAEGMIKLVEDDSVSGKALRITSEFGHDFATFQEQPVQ